MSRAENITPSMLKWARLQAALSVEGAATRLGLTSNIRGTAGEKLEAFERGDVKPTRKQLLKIAATYRRPLTTFYRSSPPVDSNRIEDFRSLGSEASNEEAAFLGALLRDVRARQDMVRSILEDDEDTHTLVFVGSMAVSMAVTDAARTIRQELGVEDEEGFWRRWNSPGELFARLREKVEDIGVFVLLIGNLGSYHTNISERIFRGFAIADDVAPFIVINDQDAVAARSFTLIHELVHIFTGSTGISDAAYTAAPDTQPIPIERFCNDVASEFLLPQQVLNDFRLPTVSESLADMVRKVAAERNVSEAMVAYRLWRADRFDDDIYRTLAKTYAKRWKGERERRREKSRQDSGTGPTYYTVRRHRLGNALLTLVGSALRDNELTHTKAAKILGVKPSNVVPLLRRINSVSGSYSPERG